MARDSRKARKQQRTSLGTLPEDIRIGDKWGEGRVNEIRELCSAYPGPHVHVIASDGHKCLGFSEYHTTFGRVG